MKKYQRWDQQQKQSQKDISSTPAIGANNKIRKDIF